MTSIEWIGIAHPDHRDDCIAALRALLVRHRDRKPEMNGFLILALVNLQATGEIDLIREAFADDVDLMVVGDIEDVEIELGLRTGRATPRDL